MVLLFSFAYFPLRGLEGSAKQKPGRFLVPITINISKVEKIFKQVAIFFEKLEIVLRKPDEIWLKRRRNKINE